MTCGFFPEHKIRPCRAVNAVAKAVDMDKFAVIDTETNWNDEVMSIGVVVADAETKKEIDSVYHIIEPEYRVGGMYSNELQFDKKKTRVINRRQTLNEIKEWLNIYGVRKLLLNSMLLSALSVEHNQA